MIPENKDRIIATVTKEQKTQLEKMSKETGITKSVLISLALTGLFEAGIKLGETTADKIINLMNKEKNDE